MGKVVKAIASLGATIIGAVVGFAIGGPVGASIGAALFSAAAAALLKPGAPRRAATAQQVQLGEQPRQAILGRAAVGGTLVDAFNYGGKDGTDWEVLVLALADHRCDALEGFFVDDTYVVFAGDGTVAGFNGQLQVFWRDGQWDQAVPSILTTYGPGWTANDRGRGVAYVVVAYKADDQKAKNPVWPGGRPRFRWVVRGLRCYDPRLDSTAGGSGAHRRDDPATWAWSDNPIVIRYNWVRGIYAGDRVTEPDKLLIGRGLSAIEAPPENVFARANLCDELVGGQPRYRIGGLVAANEPFIDVEQDFAAAVAGVITQPEGAVEVDPGEAKAPVAHFTDADLLVGSKVTWNERMLGDGDNEWVNTVVARYVEPAQRWNQHSAPVRRELADVLADGGPREAQLSLDFVTSGPQAQRVAEIFRRFGRLWGRAQVTLGPRFSWIEEGDWITWQSDRYFGGATLTFRVEAWGSDQAWHHTLTLRQISASVYADTAPLDDGAVAADQPAPGPVGQPDADDWAFASALASNGGVEVPVLRFTGAVSDPAVSQVIFEVVQQVAAPGAATEWTFAGAAAPDVTRFDAPALAGGTFWGALSYVISGIRGDRRVLGPVVNNGLSYAGGDPIAPVMPANANRVPYSRMERDQGWEAASALTLAVSYGETAGLRYFRASATASAAGEAMVLRHLRRFALTPGTRVSVQARIGTEGASADDWRLVLRGFDASGADSVIASFAGRHYLLTEDGARIVQEDGSPILLESSPPPGLRALTDEAVRFFAEVPAGIVFGRLEVEGVSAGAGAFATALAEPMVTSASAQQVVHPPFSPGPNALDGADVSLFVTGPVSHTFSYDAAGNLDPAGQMPRDFVFQMRDLAGPISSGVSWQYKIVSGAVNGFGAGPSLRAMSGTGAGTLTVSSLGSASAEIEVIASAASGTAAARLRLDKSFAAPPSGGAPGGANTARQTSGFTALAAGDTSFVTVSQEIEVTAGTSSGEVMVNIEIAAGGATGLGGADFEVLVERWNGTAWVSEGAAVAGTAISYLDAEGLPYDEPSVHVFSRSFTVTAGSAVKVRLRARRSGGASVGGLVSGSLVLTA